jgi:alkylation response protein AidB-like acyl-CoA dehydrogenase
MTDGAASLLRRSLASDCLDEKSRSVLRSVFQRLISRDEDWAWTSGQWMTERGGGSDVAGTETIATYASQPLNSRGVDGSSLGPYSISGFKWFSSATDANMSVLLAKTTDDKLSAFYAPMRRTVTNDPSKTELNGITIQRLKNKLGTKALPTAELQLSDTRAYLLGDYGRGVKEISTVLNITRVHNAVTAVGLWGRGLAISRAFARVRRIGKRHLCHIPAHVKTMAKQQVEYAAYMHLTFFTVLLLGIVEHEEVSPTGSRNASLLTSPPVQRLVPVPSHARLLLRLLTSVIKGLTAKASIAGLNECMESLGGVGYLENEDVDLNIARLFRDACVLSIWEGTTDVMATDMLKVVKGKQSDQVLEALERWLNEMLDKTTQVKEEVELLKSKFERWMRTIRRGNMEQLTINGRGLMKDLGEIVAGVLVVKDAEDTRDKVMCEVLRRWVIGDDDTNTNSAWHDTHAWNQKIVFGIESTAERSKL